MRKMIAVHMMPRTRAAYDRLKATIDARRVLDHKAAIDDHLTRWGEAPCDVDEARWYDTNEPNTTARDAADEIMCARY